MPNLKILTVEREESEIHACKENSSLVVFRALHLACTENIVWSASQQACRRAIS